MSATDNAKPKRGIALTLVDSFFMALNWTERWLGDGQDWQIAAITIMSHQARSQQIA